MTKIEAISKVLEEKGKVYALSPLDNKITYGAGDSLRWNSGAQFVPCDYMLAEGYTILKNKD